MGKVLRTALLLTIAAGFTFGQEPATSPANESRQVRSVRSPNAMGADLRVPLCQHFHDSLLRNGIAGPDDRDVTPPKLKTTVPARMTIEAIRDSQRTHIGNFSVIVDVVVDEKGVPQDPCLAKSTGYGLDGSAAAAVVQYRFDPAKKNGKPVRMRVPVEVHFVNPTPTPKGTPLPGTPKGTTRFRPASFPGSPRPLHSATSTMDRSA